MICLSILKKRLVIDLPVSTILDTKVILRVIPDKISILMNACEKSVCSTVKTLATHPDMKLHIVDPNGFNATFYAIKNPDENEGLRIL